MEYETLKLKYSLAPSPLKRFNILSTCTITCLLSSVLNSRVLSVFTLYPMILKSCMAHTHTHNKKQVETFY